jgi:hypothetical protein
MHRGCNWRPAGHFDRERYSGAEDEACYHDGHKCDGETKRPKTSTKALWPRRRQAAGALWECDLLGHLVHRVKPTRVVWRRRDCGAAIAQAPIGRAALRLVSPPACPTMSKRGERIADHRRSALERKRWRRSGMRGDRHHDEQLRNVSSGGSLLRNACTYSHRRTKRATSALWWRWQYYRHRHQGTG